MSNFLSNIGTSGQSAATFFELAMVDQGGNALWPAFQHILHTIAHQTPTSTPLHYSVHYGREIYAMLRGIVESYFLSQQNCTAFELLYGLRRAVVNKNTPTTFQQSKPPPDLTRRTILLSILEIVLLPYLTAKLDALHARAIASLDAQHNQTIASTTPTSSVTKSTSKAVADVFRSQFVRWYPYLRKSVGFLEAMYQLAFCLGRTQYFSLWHHVWKYNVVRHVPPPETPFNAGGQLATEMLNRPNTVRKKAMAWGAAAVQYSVIVGVLGFKFFEWWYTPEVQELAQQSSTETAPPPPPIELFKPSIVPIDTASVACPLCKEICTNMAACPSGFVYCYPCVYAYVEEHGRTPQGGLPCTTNDIRKCWVS
jgi:peroxin-12